MRRASAGKIWKNASVFAWQALLWARGEARLFFRAESGFSVSLARQRQTQPSRFK